MSDGGVLSGIGRTSGARNEATRVLMEEAVRTRKCPFCSPQFEEMNGERVIELDEEPEYWHVFHNSGPMTGTSFHIMLTPKRHIKCGSELWVEELDERQHIINRLRLKFGFSSFSELTRQGVMAFNSATVEHLHTHIIVSSGDPADWNTIPEPSLLLIREIYEGMVAEHGEEGALEALDELRDYVDVFRETMRGKAIPIRAKLSNKVGLNELD